jgi:hypothetical protein
MYKKAPYLDMIRFYHFYDDVDELIVIPRIITQSKITPTKK